jgi:hypothetical protein
MVPHTSIQNEPSVPNVCITQCAGPHYCMISWVLELCEVEEQMSSSDGGVCGLKQVSQQKFLQIRSETQPTNCFTLQLVGCVSIWKNFCWLACSQSCLKQTVLEILYYMFDWGVSHAAGINEL